jgi:hypothetical protein
VGTTVLGIHSVPSKTRRLFAGDDLPCALGYGFAKGGSISGPC